MNIIKLVKVIHQKGEIACETGLTIGGLSEFGIGGIDKLVIKNSFKEGNPPYIPGSSLRGKMRSLLELKHTGVQIETTPQGRREGKIHSCKNPKCPVCRIFGAHDVNDRQGPTRLIVRDSMLKVDDERIKAYGKLNGRFVEIKAENYIDRLSGEARSPRFFERVPAGFTFKLDLVYRVFDVDGDKGRTDEDYFRFVLEGLELIQRDTLGSSGSRGYGKVKITASERDKHVYVYESQEGQK
jgi:CRISPR-associated protein Csm3